ncbi:MAG: 4'-phosphopantetheinyl transferase superfamily protein [Bacteroidales bacterium]|jgi:phosphopantetheinyl transferase|nr:4'-phosphopantetheinyl transferase superfamily protein [Bacteroidales bacterium]
MQTARIDLETDVCRVVVCSFADVDCSQVELILTDDEQKRFQTLVGKRQQEFAATRTLLYALLGSSYEHIRYTAEGKPYLRNYNISISHSKHYCAIILNSQAQVGIDIEEFRPKIAQLAPRFMTDAELQQFTTIEQQTLVWCAKEALFKYSNAGSDLRRYFHIHSIDGNSEKGCISAEIKSNTMTGLHELFYLQNPDFYLVWI